jgi:uncharacterized protein YhbP (UPF0306 family)
MIEKLGLILKDAARDTLGKISRVGPLSARTFGRASALQSEPVSLMADSNVTKTRQIIASNRYLSLATGYSNDVWVAPVAYAVDADYNFYFCSAIDTRHVQHLQSNSRVAFTIFDSTLSSDDADGVQVLALASKVPVTDLVRVMELYWKQSFPDPQVRARWELSVEHFLGKLRNLQQLAFFQLSPIEIYKLDTTNPEAARRILINLKDLKSKLAHSG